MKKQMIAWLGAASVLMLTGCTQAMAQAHAAHRSMHVTDGSYRGVGSPVKLSGTPTRPARRPPRFGEHADQILAEAGYTSEEATELRDRDVAPRQPQRR